MKKTVKIILLLLCLAISITVSVLLYKNLVPTKTDRNKNEIQQTPEKNNSQIKKIKAVDFTVTDKENKEVKLSDFYGKPIVLNFWATWCGYCKNEMPAFQEMYKQYGDNVVFMIINQGESKVQAEDFLNSNAYSFPAYYDINSQAGLAYSIYNLPTTIIINKNGEIEKTIKGLMNKEALKKVIDSLISE